MGKYKAASVEIFTIFREFTPLVEGLSLDEAFLDVTASLSLFGSAADIAIAIKKRIRDVTGLTASVGVAGNKLVAKIASDLEKPDGLMVVPQDRVRQTLDPLVVQVIPGIGKETLRRLHRVDIRTIGDLRQAPDAALDAVFGRFAQRSRERASGIDERPVVPERAEKSISAEETFDVDLTAQKTMHKKLLQLTERTTSRLRAKLLSAGTVQLKIRQADFTTFTRQRSLHPPSSGTDSIYHAARKLLDVWLAEHPGESIRLLGVGGSKLVESPRPDLFSATADSTGAEVDELVDRIRDKFGSASVRRAVSLDSDQIG
jgi:DNA polymerase-4